ncbi:unnamed protein product [Closterium sp. NIES-64]|nr:unnamed protein product [Closterium sp. NIES-64]
MVRWHVPGLSTSSGSSIDGVAVKGDTAKLQKLLRKGADVNARAREPVLVGRRPLHAAAAAGNEAMVEALLAAGADVDGKDDVSNTLSCNAMQLHSHPPCLPIPFRLVGHFLPPTNAHPSVSTCVISLQFGRTPLHYLAASPSPRLGILSHLLNAGTDYAIRDRVSLLPLRFSTCFLVPPPSSTVVHASHPNPRAQPFLFAISSCQGGSMPIHVAMAGGLVAVQEALTAFALEHSAEFAFYESGQWRPFDADASRLLGFELAEGVGFAALATATGAHYIVDFQQQLQFNVSSFFCKSISWRVLPSGCWNRPSSPHQGLHPGSQDPRLMYRYDQQLRSLAQSGVDICPVYFSLTGLPPHPLLSQPAPSAQFVSRLSSSPRHEGEHGDGGDGDEDDGGDGDAQRPASSSAGVAAAAAALPAALHMSDDLSSDVPDSEPNTPLARRQPGQRAADSDDDELPRLQILRSSTDEYDEIVARFVAGMLRDRNDRPNSSFRQNSVSGGVVEQEDGMRPVTVSSVQQVLLPASRTQAFEEAVRELKGARGGDGNVRLAWHGAPRMAVDRIVSSGFSLSSSAAARNGRLYGDGVYLAPEQRAYTSAEFAVADSEGRKHMLLCRVALGSMEAIPFGSSQQRPSSLRFDTGADNVNDPSRYVVWEEDVNDLHNYILFKGGFAMDDMSAQNVASQLLDLIRTRRQPISQESSQGLSQPSSVGDVPRNLSQQVASGRPPLDPSTSSPKLVSTSDYVSVSAVKSASAVLGSAHVPAHYSLSARSATAEVTSSLVTPSASAHGGTCAQPAEDLRSGKRMRTETGAVDAAWWGGAVGPATPEHAGSDSSAAGGAWDVSNVQISQLLQEMDMFFPPDDDDLSAFALAFDDDPLDASAAANAIAAANGAAPAFPAQDSIGEILNGLSSAGPPCADLPAAVPAVPAVGVVPAVSLPGGPVPDVHAMRRADSADSAGITPQSLSGLDSPHCSLTAGGAGGSTGGMQTLTSFESAELRGDFSRVCWVGEAERPAEGEAAVQEMGAGQIGETAVAGSAGNGESMGGWREQVPATSALSGGNGGGGDNGASGNGSKGGAIPGARSLSLGSQFRQKQILQTLSSPPAAPQAMQSQVQQQPQPQQPPQQAVVRPAGAMRSPMLPPRYSQQLAQPPMAQQGQPPMAQQGQQQGAQSWQGGERQGGGAGGRGGGRGGGLLRVPSDYLRLLAESQEGGKRARGAESEWRDLGQAHSRMSALAHLVSPHGTAQQRLGYYFLEALAARIAGTGSAIYKGSQPGPSSKAMLSAVLVFCEACPWINFGHLVANGSILEAVEGATRVHVIDLGITHGTQWPTLLESLATRPGGPPHLRITGVDAPLTGLKPSSLEETGRRLSAFARVIGVPFEFTPITEQLDDLKPEQITGRGDGVLVVNCLPAAAAPDATLPSSLSISPCLSPSPSPHLSLRPHFSNPTPLSTSQSDEVLVVNCLLRLHQMRDESSAPHVPSQRNCTLQMIRSLNPAIVTLIEQHADHNIPSFLSRFREALHYFSALYESLDASLPWNSTERALVEERIFGRKLVNIIACEGRERVERHESHARWHERMQRCGFVPRAVSADVEENAHLLLKRYREGYGIERRGDALIITWRHEPFFAASNWLLPTPHGLDSCLPVGRARGVELGF